MRVCLVLTYGEWGALRLFFDKVGNQLGLDRILHMMVQTGPDRTRLDQTGPDCTRLDWTGPDQTGPDWTGPDKKGQYQTRLDWTGPDQTRPD